MYRKTYVEINLNNIENNIKNIINSYKYKYYIAVIKGNAYGHGYGIVKTLIASGINYLAVSSLEEALSVRNEDKNIPIMCLQPIKSNYLEICSKNNISICVNDIDYFNEVKELKLKLNIHVKIDTGMNRLGFNNKEEIKKVYEEIKESKYLFLEGIFTHFATSGLVDKEYDNQLNRFEELTSPINLNTIPIVHLDKSSTMVLHEKTKYANGVRLGIIMFGFDCYPKLGNSFKDKLRNIKRNYIRNKNKISSFKEYKELNLKPTFKLISEIIEIKEVKKDSYIGYGISLKTKEDIRIAIVDIGYEDGINRKRRGSFVDINNKLFPIIADVGMRMIIVQVDNTINKEDKVIILGDKVNIKKIARYLNTSSYEVMCMIDSNIPRIYVKE